jgi:hypothetical protein
MAFYLGDDGTLDTVLVCRECGREYRYNYDGGLEWNGHDEPTNDNKDGAYTAFVDECIADAEDSHICGEDE